MPPDMSVDRKEYREQVSWPLWFHIAMGAVTVFAAFGGWKALRDPGPSWLPLVLLLFAGGIFLVWYTFRHLEIEVGPEGVAYGFGRIRRRVPRERISGIEVERYPVARYMGWGYRIGWGGGDRAFSVIGCPRGLRVHFTDERGREWHVFLSCTDPERALAAYAIPS